MLQNQAEKPGAPKLALVKMADGFHDPVLPFNGASIIARITVDPKSSNQVTSEQLTKTVKVLMNIPQKFNHGSYCHSALSEEESVRSPACCRRRNIRTTSRSRTAQGERG